MWRFVLTVSLLCWRSEGTVTCRDNNNGIVDWYIIYKAPAKKSSRTGLEYLYIDSTEMTKMVPSMPNYKSIKDPNGILANTLRPLFTPIRSMPQNFGFISYSDQPPGCNADAVFGHSKGVLMVDKTGTGVWLLHSTPQFPFRRDPNHFWPDSGARNAQTFICVTFSYDKFSTIGHHLQYIRAFPFEHDIPGDFHKELRDAANRDKLPPLNKFQTLRSYGGHDFYSIAKQRNKQPEVGDLYVTIAQGVKSDLHVQTWGCQRNCSSSYCVTGMHEVLKTETVRTDLGDWNSTRDHSKWCVAKDQNKHWTCIADVNRAPTQYLRRGGALCIQNERIQKIFLRFAGTSEDCPNQNSMDLTNSDCEPDPLTLTDHVMD
ncbi:plancitoxin-1-like [Epinephelus fuscoguttatus]|uniref:plancitoxin-1-like n=1 Tax=Epinephelus fuscoguttatus TaxID=293821 RepID=UPI0020D02E36|nr:plancitoxin-1-like [Epinephelus fuscoguttatus]XP_049460228.1 plancitoxin-1-like [Epinephelus fuscoguttatus]XP_049460229.1 plancitoxin-1-like [Epinephelus fuscoguttatus]